MLGPAPPDATDAAVTRDGGATWSPLRIPEAALAGAHRAEAVVVSDVGTIVGSERHLERVLADYTRHFNADRPHQGLAQQIPAGPARPANTNGRVVETPVLRGLHHAYRRAG